MGQEVILNWRKPVLKPSNELENMLRIINQAFSYSKSSYWLCFGGLWGLIQNNGVVPDGDLDLCTYYGEDYQRIAKTFERLPGQYKMTKALLSDTDGKALYCSYSSGAGLPHFCLSFWYEHKGIRYFCHDQRHEVDGVGTPKSGYWFRGVPAYSVADDDCFRMAEWYGINQAVKVRVPRFPGVILDHIYPDWAYKKQRYEIGKKHEVKEDKCESYHRGGAISPYAVHVQSMNQFGDEKYIAGQLLESKRAWDVRLKNGR